MSQRTLRVTLLSTIPIASFFVALMAHAYLGFFARYLADDYCTANVILSEGLIAAQKYWYVAWSGRFSFTLAVSLVELAGPDIVPFLPSIALALWLIGMTWAILQIGLVIRLPHPMIVSLFLAGLIIFATLDGAPSVVQSFYWQTGMLTYVAPLIFLTIYGGFIFYRLRPEAQSRTTIPWLILSAILTFIAGGFSETYVALQTSALFLAIVVCFVTVSSAFKRIVCPLIIAGFAGSVLAMIIVLVAPGSSARQALFSAPPGFLSMVGLSLQNAFSFVRESVDRAPFALTVSLALPALLAFILPLQKRDPTSHSEFKSRKLVQLLLLSPVAGFMLILSSFAPAIYGISVAPPARALIAPQFVLVCVTAGWGYLAGLVLTRVHSLRGKSGSSYFIIFSSVVVVVLLGLGPIASARRVFALSPVARVYASMWDSRDQEIRTARGQGFTDLVVPMLPYSGGLEDIDPNPDHWVNRCVARYYGLDSIVAR